MNSSNLLDRLYVAKPCTANWNMMQGDERVRFCSECQLHVYNISAMSAAEGQALVARTEGHLCVRLYRRADGTLITSDCPVGLRLWRRRVSRTAGAFLTGLLSLFTGSPVTARATVEQGGPFVQTQLKVNRKRSQRKDPRARLRGTVYDINKAVIAGAQVTLINESDEKKIRKVVTDDEGAFLLSGVVAGRYTIVIEARGFQIFTKRLLKVEEREDLTLDATLEVGTVGGAALLPQIPVRITAE